MRLPLPVFVFAATFLVLLVLERLVFGFLRVPTKSLAAHTLRMRRSRKIDFLVRSKLAICKKQTD